jgi:hypothetical protein
MVRRLRCILWVPLGGAAHTGALGAAPEHKMAEANKAFAHFAW